MNGPNATEIETEHEALLAFLYLCPTGVVQFDSDGTIRMINPHATQLLVPISPTGSLNNILDVLGFCAPELRNIIAAFVPDNGQICQGHRIHVRGSGPGPRFLSCSILKISADCLTAVLQDVSREVEQEQQLKQSEALFASIVTGVNDFALFSLDVQGRINTWNLSGVRQTSFKADDVLGHDLNVLIHPDNAPAGLARAQVAIATREGWSLREARCIRRNGQCYWSQILIAAVEDGDRGIEGYTVVMRDVTERRMNGEELRRLLTTDHLTGAVNRVHFFERAASELGRYKRSGHTFSVVMLDVDHFKQVNDGFGHAVGDALLQALVRHCRSCLDERATFARLGGEEFVVLLPDIGISKAASIAESMRQTVADELATLRGLPVGVTISLGCAEIAADIDGIDALLRCADEALYRAKRGGRDQVVLASLQLPLSRVVAA